MAVCVRVDGDVQRQVWRGHHALGVLWPLAQLQSRAGEDVAKPGVFPLAWVAETVKVEMPHRARGHVIGLDHRVGGALDAPAHPQGAQHMAHPSGFACAQVTLQGDAGVQRRMAG